MGIKKRGKILEKIRKYKHKELIIYVILNIIEVIIIPINLLPTIAIASNLWGGFISASLAI